MKITNLDEATFLDWLYLHSPISHLIDENFNVIYRSGEDGVFMEIFLKDNNTDLISKVEH